MVRQSHHKQVKYLIYTDGNFTKDSDTQKEKNIRDLSTCIICGTAKNSRKLLHNSEMVAGIFCMCEERESLCDYEVQPIYNKLCNLSETDLEKVTNHSECRKPFVKKDRIDRFKKKLNINKKNYYS